MPVYPSLTTFRPTPSSLHYCGHSYLNTTVGVLNQRYRIDAYLRQMLNIQAGNTTNRALSGAMLIRDNAGYGSAITALQQIVKSQRTAPYIGDGGTMVLCWGINDLGNIPSTGVAADVTKLIASYKEALRAVISRWRTSSLKEDTDASVAYGANWTTASGTSAFSSGTSIRGCLNTTTNNVATITLPADFTGQTVVLGFVGQTSSLAWGAAWDTDTAGFGGTVTLGGTALTTGHAGGASASNGATVTNGSKMPIGTAHLPIVKRITDLDSTAASKTITITCTAVQTGAGATCYFDYWALESLTPPIVVVCNVSRSTSGSTTIGYGGYGSVWSGGTSYWKAQGTPGATGDADVAALNVAIAAVCAEFDGAVQIADIDSQIGAQTARLNPGDNIHPNEVGALYCAVEIARAIRAAQAVTPIDTSIPGNYIGGGAARRPRQSAQWYAPENFSGTLGTMLAGTNFAFGDMWAVPLIMTEGNDRLSGVRMEVTTTGTTTSVRWGIYDDEDWLGYPQMLIEDWTAGGAQNAFTSGAISNTTLNRPLDFGLYWLVVKCEVVGATTVWRSFTGAGPILPQVTGATPASAWKIAGQGTGILPQRFPTGAAVTSPTPFVQVQRG